MSRPVSNLAIFIAGYTAMNAFARSGTSVSNEGQEIEQRAGEERFWVENSQSLFGSRGQAISEAQRLAAECSEDDWDGNGSLGVSPKTLETVLNFIRSLPFNYPAPELAVDPDGSMSLDWICSRHRMFSVGIGTNDRLVFAWLDGVDRGRGVVDFDGTKTPHRILDAIRATVGDINASLRAA